MWNKVFSYYVPVIRCFAAISTGSVALAQTYEVERVVSGLDRPAHVVQAPGDDTKIYIVESQGGTGTTGDGIGRVKVFDLSTQVLFTLLEYDTIDPTIEGGVHTMAFHPDFQTNGLFYVNWLEDGGNGASGPGDFGTVDEYQLVDGDARFSKRLFRYQLRDNRSTHGLDWVGFDPTAIGEARNYIYITTGDGGFDGANTNFSQDLSVHFGKVFRVDVRGDDYPGDSNRNFSIPADNPYANDGDPDTLAEIFHSGLRNPWRASFDRASGDMYIGDVGLGSREEVDFVLVGESGLDFGWNALEGTIIRGTSIHPGQRMPIHEYDHSAGNRSVTGGYVYRGPVEELQGRYFYGDFLSGRIWTALFDRSTPANSFNGANLTDIREIREQLEGLVPGGAAIDHIVSFGEDNAGNLYIVDFGSGPPLSPNYDTGEIFLLRKDPCVNPDALILSNGNSVDLNDDCVINMADFAIFSRYWLDCHLVLSHDCP